MQRHKASKHAQWLALLVIALMTRPALSVNFQWGEIEGTFTSALSMGASWRTQSADKDNLSPGNTNGEGRASTSTTDDGNLNYDSGDMYSLLFKGVHDLELNAGNYGAFTRFKYWYDYALADQDVEHGHVANNYKADSKLDTDSFEDLAQDSGFEFLDYYLYGSFDLGPVLADLRAGRMVLSWGESTFIQNGVNIINPFDVTALRRPGSEIKEALLPVGLLYANLGLTTALSVETFYQYEWERTILDECGTYWSSADVYGGGCDKLTTSTAAPDGDQIAAGGFIPRASDIKARDGGQWGIAARYFAESLNATEFGAYYVRYHSRTPIFSGVKATQNNPISAFLPEPIPGNPRYVFEFPENLEVYGLTFATNIGFWAVSGELSWRPDFPLQINTTDITQTIALGGNAEWTTIQPRYRNTAPGGVVHGFDEVEYTQIQATFIRFFEQVLGANRLSFAGEVAAVDLADFNEDRRYGRSATYGTGAFQPFISSFYGAPISCGSPHPVLGPAAGVQPNSQPQNCTDEGFVEDFSWGYRMRASLEYLSAFMGWNLTPNIAWSHDVEGYSPPPNFIEDRKAFSIGLTADYLNTYKADISYTEFFGAKYNDQNDRDFVSLSFSVAF